MTTNKSATAAASETTSSVECCMCGDCGFSSELFLCKLCQFRSQHRYCSNLYPKAESYRICNWCLNQKDESKEKSQNSSNSSSSNKPTAQLEDYTSIKKTPNFDTSGCLKHQQVLNRPIKKHKSLDAPAPARAHPPPAPSRRRSLPEENLRKARSEEISPGTAVKRPVIFRNKVRRYKLLEEVSS